MAGYGADKDPRDAFYCDPEDRVPDDPGDYGDLREYDNEPTMAELRGEIQELRHTLKHTIRHHGLLKQMFLAMQKQNNINHQRVQRLMHITELAGDINAMFKEILVEKKITSLPVKLTSEQQELIATKSFLEVTDQLETLKTVFADQQAKFVALTNWVADRFEGMTLASEIGVPKIRSMATPKLKETLAKSFYEDDMVRRLKVRNPK